MIAYTIFVILTTLMITSGIFLWIISMFSEKVERPILSLIGYLFWPISLLFIWIYIYFYNKYNSNK